MKKVIASLLSVAMIAAMAGCNQPAQPTGSASSETKSGESKPAETTTAGGETTTTETTVKESYGEGPVHINMWSFTNEVPNMAKKYISLNPDFGKKYTIDVTIIATTNGTYQPALDAALKNGEVDLYAAEAAFVLKYAQGDAAQFAAAYKDLGIDVDKDLKDAEIAQYTVDIGTRPSDKALVALGYQATGGAMIYRASIAKEVFGSDEAATVEKEVGAGSGNYDTFWKAAEKLKAKGYPIVSGDGDVWHMVENSSSSGWIVDGKLNIAPERQAFFDISKQLLDKGWSNETQDWTPAWYADMKGVSQEGKDNKPAFCFFGPAWLINYVMVGNSGGTKAGEGTYGDWRVCKAPAGFFWGGTWVLASKTAAENADKKAGQALEKAEAALAAAGTGTGSGVSKEEVAKMIKEAAGDMTDAMAAAILAQGAAGDAMTKAVQAYDLADGADKKADKLAGDVKTLADNAYTKAEAETLKGTVD